MGERARGGKGREGREERGETRGIDTLSISGRWEQASRPLSVSMFSCTRYDAHWYPLTNVSINSCQWPVNSATSAVNGEPVVLAASAHACLWRFCLGGRGAGTWGKTAALKAGTTWKTLLE